MRWLRSFTRITYQSKLIGIPSIAAFLQPELLEVYTRDRKWVFPRSALTYQVGPIRTGYRPTV
ncbi:hypothetical protein DF211_05915 [Pectobacterium parmentieri]|nr:hypothetical protein DF211_05915 [Pectobacterium parmentieri]